MSYQDRDRLQRIIEAVQSMRSSHPGEPDMEWLIEKLEPLLLEIPSTANPSSPSYEEDFKTERKNWALGHICTNCSEEEKILWRRGEQAFESGWEAHREFARQVLTPDSPARGPSSDERLTIAIEALENIGAVNVSNLEGLGIDVRDALIARSALEKIRGG